MKSFLRKKFYWKIKDPKKVPPSPFGTTRKVPLSRGDGGTHRYRTFFYVLACEDYSSSSLTLHCASWSIPSFVFQQNILMVEVDNRSNKSNKAYYAYN